LIQSLRTSEKVILIYHNIIPERSNRPAYAGLGLPLHTFEQQLDWLSRHRRIVALDEYLKIRKLGQSTRKLVALTFDDGVRTTFDRAYPLLQKRAMPATFFIATSHLKTGRLLWFSYLNALCFEGVYGAIEVEGIRLELSSEEDRIRTRHSLGRMARTSRDPRAFSDELAAAYPLPRSILAEYEGMSAAQLSLFGQSELLEAGAHTVNHPFMDQLSEDEQKREIVDSKQELMKLTGTCVRYFAYPSGDYNCVTVRLLEAAGFEAAFATHQKRLSIHDRFEMVRVGIYSISFSNFWLKAQGAASVAQRLGLGAP
jgi:peptidoglycan/xylan/chitin deacetylase (PgdA/CDA1 family)